MNSVMSLLLRAGVVLPLVAVGLSACGGGSSSPPPATCLGEGNEVAVYVSFSKGGGGYAEGFSQNLAGCAQRVDTGVGAGLAMNPSGGLESIGLIKGTSQLRVINDVATRANTSFDLLQDFAVPVTTEIAPAGMLVQAFGSNDALTVVGDSTVPAAGTDLTKVPALHASFATVTQNSANLQLETVMQSVTGGAVWNTAYDATNDRLFAAGLNGVVSVFDNFQLQVAAGTPPPRSRTITPGAIDDSGNSNLIAGALHGIDYDAATDQLVVTDFDHGAIYVFGDASTANDTPPAGVGPSVVVPQRIVSGSATRLAKPSDAKLDANGDLLVVEQGSGGLVLQFNSFLVGSDSAPAPDIVASGLGGMPQFIGLAPAP